MEETIDKLFDSINMVRTTPKFYADRLQSQRDQFHGDIFRTESKEIRTLEGVKPCDELINELVFMRPIRPLKWSFSLHVVADDQAQYLGNTGLASHLGPDNRKLPDRVAPYAVINGRVNEVIELGSYNSSDILMDLLVDDGLISRKRRKALLDPNYEYVGIAWSMHKTYGFCTVIVLAENVSELIQPTGKLLELDKSKVAPDLNQNFYKILPDPRITQLHHCVQEESVIVERSAPPPFVMAGRQTSATLPTLPQSNSNCALI